MKSLAKICCVFLMGLALAPASVYAAQLYRWVDSKGNVEWRDTPPPPSVPEKNIQQRRVGDNLTASTALPYSVQLAMKNHPVKLWATDCGPPCSSARAHLNRRGTPFTEKAPQSDLAGFRKVSPESEVPILQVGIFTLKGYRESEWDNTLDSTGYPRTATAIRPNPGATPPPAKPAVDSTKDAEAAPVPAPVTPPAAAK